MIIDRHFQACLDAGKPVRYHVYPHHIGATAWLYGTGYDDPLVSSGDHGEWRALLLRLGTVLTKEECLAIRDALNTATQLSGYEFIHEQH